MGDHYIYLGELIQLAEKYYPKKKYIHATRVATYALEKAINSKKVKPIDAYAVGLAHDLIEDTDCTPEDLQAVIDDELIGAVLEVTKGEDQSYHDYIMEIIETGSDLAKLVKGADMKDHMMKSETLTDKLWEKYKPYLKYFL